MGLHKTVDLKAGHSTQKNTNASHICDISSPEMKGSGLKEVAGWEEQNSEQHVTGEVIAAPSSSTCEQVKEGSTELGYGKNYGSNLQKKGGINGV